MLSIALYAHKTRFFFSSLCKHTMAVQTEFQVSGYRHGSGWVMAKNAFQKHKCSPLQTERLPGTLCKMVFRLLLYQLCSEWKHPSPRDQKQGHETREIRNEWHPNYRLDFLTTKLKLSIWDGASSVRAQTSFPLSLESFPWWEIQPSLLQDTHTT